jgi:hypothetical protein
MNYTNAVLVEIHIENLLCCQFVSEDKLGTFFELSWRI